MDTKNKKLKIIIIIQLILNITFIFLLLRNNNLSPDQNGYESENVSNKQLELSQLKSDFERIKLERKKLGLSNDTLVAEIEEIEKLMEQLKEDNDLTENQIKQLTNNITSFRNEVKTNDEAILRLKEKNLALIENVDSLSNENKNLNENLKRISKENEYMQKDLKWASILSAQKIEVVGFKENDKEITNQPFSSKKLSHIKVTFDIAENRATDHNEKTFYLCMITPSGEVFSDKRNGGGNLTDHNGNKVKYTLSKSLKFENSNQWLSMVMLKGYNYVSGNYIIQIYCDGYIIGQGGFLVK